MTILVTGSQGFIGRYVVAHLLSMDHDVVGIGRSADDRKCFTHEVTWAGRKLRAPLPRPLRAALASDRYGYEALDLRDTAALTRLFEARRFEIVLHLAGALRGAPFRSLVQSNLEGSHSLFETCARADPRPRLVFTSSGSVYGAVSPERLPLRAAAAEAVQPIDLYSTTKRAAEDVAMVAAREHDLTVSIGRVFVVVGPGQEERHLCGHLARQFAERRAGRSQDPIVVGPLNTTRDFIDVRDVAKALATAAFHGDPPRLFNIASGVETPTADVFSILKAKAQDGSELAPTLSARSLELGRSFADIEELTAMGFVPGHSLEESLGESLDYYLNDVAEAADGHG